MTRIAVQALPEAPVATDPPAALPVVELKPSRSWVALDLKDLWSYRELFLFLAWRDVKIRYKQTLLGAAWAVIQPLFAMAIFTVIFGRLAKMPSDGIPYPIFAYAGLLPWTFFQNAVTTGSNSLVGSANLVTKVYFPRIIIPSAAVGAGLVDLAISFALLGVLMVYYGVALSWSLLVLPLLVVMITLLAVGVGLWTSALNVKFRDIRYALPFLIQVWMYASPIVYPSTLVSPEWRWVLALNPLTGIIEGFRAALFPQREFDWVALGVSAAMTLVILVYSAFYFRRMEKNFADVI